MYCLYVNECYANPCRNSRECLKTSDCTTVTVDHSWSGEDECSGYPCQKSYECVNTPASYYCNCRSILSGVNCCEGKIYTEYVSQKSVSEYSWMRQQSGYTTVTVDPDARAFTAMNIKVRMRMVSIAENASTHTGIDQDDRAFKVMTASVPRIRREKQQMRQQTES